MNSVMNVNELSQLGQLLAKSKMFGTDKPEECIVIAGLCHQEGISWMEFMRKYHMIQGKISMRADAMLADYQRLGGAITVKQRDSNGSIVVFDYNGTSYESKCIWEEVKDEDFCNSFNRNTGKREIKENYKYPRKRMQMLWARAVSDGIRVICPQAVQGVYTPEEVVDFNNVPRREIPNAKPNPDEVIVGDDDTIPTTDNEIMHCPVPGKLNGMLWDDMTTLQLEGVLRVANQYPELSQDHIDFINLILESRKED